MNKVKRNQSKNKGLMNSVKVKNERGKAMFLRGRGGP
jgi:hypothetical protein